MKKNTVQASDWSTIPVPIDDGTTRHLVGSRAASVSLPSTDGEHVDLSALPQSFKNRHKFERERRLATTVVFSADQLSRALVLFWSLPEWVDLSRSIQK
jgi:hypothetical protein